MRRQKARVQEEEQTVAVAGEMDTTEEAELGALRVVLPVVLEDLQPSLEEQLQSLEAVRGPQEAELKLQEVQPHAAREAHSHSLAEPRVWEMELNLRESA